MKQEKVQRIIGNDRFIIVGKEGDGDFGHVWKAMYATTRKLCAIKQKKFTDEDLGDVDDLFEKQVNAKIKHGNVIEVHEHFRVGREHFLVMEYCDGGTLEDKIEDMIRGEDSFSEDSAKSAVQQICCGLKAIHEAGYYHRDISPRNVLISEGKILIGDLGLIKKSRQKSSTIRGSAQYIPLEQQVRDKKTGIFNADLRSDIFAVGVIFYELLSGGKRPFRDARDDAELLKLKRDTNYISRLTISGVNGKLLEIIKKCLQPKPDDRYQSVQEMLDDLEEKTFASKHVTHIESVYKEMLNYLKRKNKYGTSAPQDVLTIINRRRNIQTYIKDCNLFDDPDVLEKLQEIDGMIFQQRKADYKIMWTLARPDRQNLATVRKDLMKQSKCATWEGYLRKNKEKIDLYALLCEPEYWDFNECGVNPNNSKNETFFEEDWQWFIDNLVFEAEQMKASESFIQSFKLISEETKTESISEKIKILKKVVRLNPVNQTAHIKLREIYLALKEFDKALKHAKKVVEIKPSAEAYNNLGVVHYWKKEYDEGKKCYEEAIKLNPRYAIAYSNLGLNYKRRGNHAKAKELFIKAIEVNSMESHAHVNLADVCSSEGKLDDAIEHCRKAVKYAPNNASAHEKLASCYSKKGMNQEAEQYRKKADELKEKKRAELKKYQEVGKSLARRMEELKKT